MPHVVVKLWPASPRLPAAHARSHRVVLAERDGLDGCPLRSLPLAASALHCKHATAYADAPGRRLQHDTGYFVRLTGINPTVATAMIRLPAPPPFSFVRSS
jgi:hypothetical protein